MIGKRIGTYRIEELLGIGGMGEVFRGWDEENQQSVALKRLPPEGDADESLHRRFQREAKLAAQLDHPAIVRFLKLLENDDGAWIVMEFVEGTSLSDLLEYHGRFQPSRVVELARQIAEGLVEAHEKGIIHRDLKTENVLIDGQGKVRILDFGLAKHLWRDESGPALTQEGTMVGTCRAMSPEQALAEPIDARSDLFSLGVLLYELLTGTTPFSASTPLQTVALVVGQPHPPILERNPRVPRELADLVDALLRKNAVDRPQSAREVIEICEGIRPPPRWQSFVGWLRGFPYVVLYALVALMVVDELAGPP